MLKQILHIGIDDTDSPKGMCTTFLAYKIINRLKKENVDFLEDDVFYLHGFENFYDPSRNVLSSQLDTNYQILVARVNCQPSSPILTSYKLHAIVLSLASLSLLPLFNYFTATFVVLKYPNNLVDSYICLSFATNFNHA